jgi:type IV pilus assembly protein PilM
VSASKSSQRFSEWWHSGKLHLSELLPFKSWHNQQGLIGMVIDPYCLKLLKLTQIYGQYLVEYFDMVELPGNLLVNAEIKNVKVLASILQETIQRSGLESQNIVFSIPRSSVIVRKILVDKNLSQEKIEALAWKQAKQIFPNLQNELYLDFTIQEIEATSSQFEVNIVMCRKEQLASYLEILRLADLNAKAVDLHDNAYERALYLILTQSQVIIKNVAFLNIDFNSIELTVLREGNVIYKHELAFNGYHLLQFRQHMESNFEPSMLDKFNQTALTTLGPYDAIRQTLGIQIKQAMQFFYAKRFNIKIDQVILGGDVSSAIPQTIDYVHQELGGEIILANPFKEMKCAPAVDKEKLVRHASSLVLTCGLALTNLI